MYERSIPEGSYTEEAVLVYEKPIPEGSYTEEAVLVYKGPLKQAWRPFARQGGDQKVNLT